MFSMLKKEKDYTDYDKQYMQEQLTECLTEYRGLDGVELHKKLKDDKFRQQYHSFMIDEFSKVTNLTHEYIESTCPTNKELTNIFNESKSYYMYCPDDNGRTEVDYNRASSIDLTASFLGIPFLLLMATTAPDGSGGATFCSIMALALVTIIPAGFHSSKQAKKTSEIIKEPNLVLADLGIATKGFKKYLTKNIVKKNGNTPAFNK